MLDFTLDAPTLAQRLLGCTLVRVLPDGTRLAGTVVETEAYCGVQDLAAHAKGGHRSPRNESMYQKGGTAYVYFTYGMHHCLNVVCGEIGEPSAVLLRAIEPTEGLERMRVLRRKPGAKVLQDKDLCSGPARLCQALGVDLTLDGHDLTKGLVLWVESGPELPRSELVRTARVGVAYAKGWATKPLRWYKAGSPHVSSGKPTTPEHAEARASRQT